tara:strand:- start:1540 stop:1893 length:354 start_codon:yes stop_codon:yes gene_type:complete
MTIEVLKSKITNIKVKSTHVNNEGVIKLSKNLMDEMNIVNFEKVMVINQSGRYSSEFKFAFVEELTGKFNRGLYTIITPISIASACDTISIMSTTRTSVDEPIKSPIIINAPKSIEL